MHDVEYTVQSCMIVAPQSSSTYSYIGAEEVRHTDVMYKTCVLGLLGLISSAAEKASNSRASTSMLEKQSTCTADLVYPYTIPSSYPSVLLETLWPIYNSCFIGRFSLGEASLSRGIYE